VKERDQRARRAVQAGWLVQAGMLADQPDEAVEFRRRSG